MVELPTGTVTFLFTDIEGSTRLLQKLGAAYAGVLHEHAGILRQAAADGGGAVVGTQGDSFFLVFADPAGAVASAVAAQRALATHHWSFGPPVRVRMGLHTGQGVLSGGDYVGMDVHRAARIAAAAHGGQVLLSSATRGLVEHDLPQGISLRDLGPHRLKDIAHPEHLYDLVIQGLPSDHPPPLTLDARANNLPVQLTSFVGREREIEEVRRLLASARLLTLTGPGGGGKTRLALQVAAESLSTFPDGAFVADLSAVSDPALVPAAMARALGVPEAPDRPIPQALREHLADKELLLVVDNFEQVLPAAPLLEDLLMAAPRLRVMATSRVALSLRGEQEYVIPPLTPPDPARLPDLATLRRMAAIQLFTERACAASPRFRVTAANAPAVAEIIARLDGLPLGIELAATRTKLLTPQQMLPRLQHRLGILTSGARTVPERQRTLRGAIAWSHDLLEPPERTLFARLSVFTGGWALPAAEAVCDLQGLGLDVLEGITSLLDQSLLRRAETVDGAESRFSMLETIREFALERLEASGDLPATRRRHGEYFLDLAVEAEPHLMGKERGWWLDRCDLEHANVRAALRWAIRGGDVDRAQLAAGAMALFWEQRGHLDEGRRWLDEILALPSGQGRTPSRARALIGAGVIAWWQKDLPASRSFHGEALAIERELGDPRRIAEALVREAFIVGATEPDVEAVVQLLDESLRLFRHVGDEAGTARVLSLLSRRDAAAGDWGPVIAKAEEAVAIWRRIGDHYDMSYDLIPLADAYGRVGRTVDARSALLEAMELFREIDNPTAIVLVLLGLSFLASWEGRYEAALRLASASESLRERYGGGLPSGSVAFPFAFTGDPEAEPRAHLAEAVAARAWEAGRIMDVDDAVALASREGDQPPAG